MTCSSVARDMPEPRPAERTKADWLCKFCKGRDGKSFRNFGHRTACRTCNIAKGSCFAGNVEKGPPGGSPSLAVRQVRQQRADEATAKKARQKEDELAKIKAELRRRDEQLKAVRGEASTDNSGNNEDGVASPTFEYTVDQLLEQRKLLKTQGKSDDHIDVVRIDRQVKIQREAKLAEKPGHARVAKADRKVKQCRDNIEASEAMAAKLQEELAALQERIAANAGEIGRARGALAEAEHERDELHKSLQTATPLDIGVPVSPLAALGIPEALLDKPELAEAKVALEQVDPIIKRLQAIAAEETRQSRAACAPLPENVTAAHGVLLASAVVGTMGAMPTGQPDAAWDFDAADVDDDMVDAMLQATVGDLGPATGAEAIDLGAGHAQADIAEKRKAIRVQLAANSGRLVKKKAKTVCG